MVYIAWQRYDLRSRAVVPVRRYQLYGIIWRLLVMTGVIKLVSAYVYGDISFMVSVLRQGIILAVSIPGGGITLLVYGMSVRISSWWYL